MKLINIGFGNIISVDRVVSIVSPDSAPIKRMIQEAKDNRTAIDATYGRRTRAVIIMDSGHIVEEGVVSDIFSAPQSDVTKDFLSSLTNVQDSMVRWSKDGGHYTLRFRGSTTDEPIISSVSSATGAIFNIRAAGVQNVNGEELGVMVTDIGPDEETAKKAVALLREKRVLVEETKVGV